MADTADVISKAWDSHYANKLAPVWVWWSSPLVRAHYFSLAGISSECHALQTLTIRYLQKHFGNRLPLRHGLSVGCGTGSREIALVEAGIVESMTLYEFSRVALEIAEKNAKAKGIAHKMQFILGDAFALERSRFDLVYWDNALHHMPDVHTALVWSRNRLEKNGILYMNDFVGASRFQWGEELLNACNNVLEAFGIAPVYPPSYEYMVKSDPSEAADSARIKEELFSIFPNATWVPTGGAIYHVGLTGREFEIPDNVLAKLLHFDAVLNSAGTYVYAIASAVKE